VEHQTQQLLIHLAYPSRVRHNLPAAIELRLRNHSDRTHNVHVAVDPAYLTTMREVYFTPPADGSSEVQVGALAPGQVRSLAVEFRAASAGRVRGWIRVTAEGFPAEIIEFETLVLP
jgi:hypothetical protein